MVDLDLITFIRFRELISDLALWIYVHLRSHGARLDHYLTAILTSC